jgi:hypothetical protein
VDETGTAPAAIQFRIFFRHDYLNIPRLKHKTVVVSLVLHERKTAKDVK